jgi:hypothetical protein
MAATYAGPGSAPPGGNIPTTIWNRLSGTATQSNAAVAIDGGGATMGSFVGLSVGTSATDMGAAAAGQNLMYGIADYAKMNAGDALLRLQVNSAGTIYDRFYVTRDATGVLAGSMAVGGNLNVGYVGTFGSAALSLNPADTGTNLLYGVANYANMHPSGDYLLKLQTYSGTAYDDRMTINRDGDINTPGRVHGTGCVGHTFVGLTTSGGALNDGLFTPTYIVDNFPGGGYGVVNARCGANYTGAHVCRPEELLESFSCAKAGDPILSTTVVPDGTPAFVNGGPPGYKALANDCDGWTSKISTAYGRIWFFNTTTGGKGSQTQCNVATGIRYACCR